MENKEIFKQVEYYSHINDREVGLSHPDNNSFIRLSDDGDIIISSSAGASIVLSSKSSSITLIADRVKVLSRHDNGFIVNGLALNEAATTFQEPSLIELDKELDSQDVYHGVDYYLDALEELQEEEEEVTEEERVAQEILERWKKGVV